MGGRGREGGQTREREEIELLRRVLAAVSILSNFMAFACSLVLSSKQPQHMAHVFLKPLYVYQCARQDRHIDAYIYMYACMQPWMSRYARLSHGCVHVCEHVHTYTYIHTYIHACMHAYIKEFEQKTKTCTHTHTWCTWWKNVFSNWRQRYRHGRRGIRMLLDH